MKAQVPENFGMILRKTKIAKMPVLIKAAFIVLAGASFGFVDAMLLG